MSVLASVDVELEIELEIVAVAILDGSCLTKAVVSPTDDSYTFACCVGRQGNNILLMSAAAEAAADGAEDPDFMQLPRSYEVVHDAPIARPPPPQQRTTVKTSICPLDVRIVGDPKSSGRTVVTLHDAGTALCNLVGICFCRTLWSKVFLSRVFVVR